jgi:hypothetical protein
MTLDEAQQAAALWYRVTYEVRGDIWMAKERIDSHHWYVEIISEAIEKDIGVVVWPDGSVTKVNEGACKLRSQFPAILLPENAYHPQSHPQPQQRPQPPRHLVERRA